MKNYVFIIIVFVAAGVPLVWNIIYLAQIASDCGAPYYYCAYELTFTLPLFGWSLFSAFFVQQATFLTYFIIYKKDLDEVKYEEGGISGYQP